jgi:hypothetical protein
MLFNYGNSSREFISEPYDADYRWAYYTGEPSRRYTNKYYRMGDAVAAYREAYRLSGKNKELAATALLMLAHCDMLNHRYPNNEKLPKGVYTSYWLDEEDPYASPYLTLLRKSLASSAVYRLAVTECPDVEAFENRQ